MFGVKKSLTLIYRKEMEALALELRCYCGWFTLGNCTHCPKDRSLADKLVDRGNTQFSSVCRCNDIIGRKV